MKRNPWALVVGDGIQLIADINESNKRAVYLHLRANGSASAGGNRSPRTLVDVSHSTVTDGGAGQADRPLPLWLVGLAIVCAAGTALLLLNRLTGHEGKEGL